MFVKIQQLGKEKVRERTDTFQVKDDHKKNHADYLLPILENNQHKLISYTMETTTKTSIGTTTVDIRYI